MAKQVFRGNEVLSSAIKATGRMESSPTLTKKHDVVVNDTIRRNEKAIDYRLIDGTLGGPRHSTDASSKHISDVEVKYLTLQFFLVQDASSTLRGGFSAHERKEKVKLDFSVIAGLLFCG